MKRVSARLEVGLGYQPCGEIDATRRCVKFVRECV